MPGVKCLCRGTGRCHVGSLVAADGEEGAQLGSGLGSTAFGAREEEEGGMPNAAEQPRQQNGTRETSLVTLSGVEKRYPCDPSKHTRVRETSSSNKAPPSSFMSSGDTHTRGFGSSAVTSQTSSSTDPLQTLSIKANPLIAHSHCPQTGVIF